MKRVFEWVEYWTNVENQEKTGNVLLAIALIAGILTFCTM